MPCADLSGILSYFDDKIASVDSAGFEPATSSLRTGRATRLRHEPFWHHFTCRQPRLIACPVDWM